MSERQDQTAKGVLLTDRERRLILHALRIAMEDGSRSTTAATKKKTTL
jgi:hypothetical protein